MATIVFPLLLVLGALGGVLVVVGRRLPKIRDVLQAADDVPPRTPSPQTSTLDADSLAPRSVTLSRPTGSVFARSLTVVRERGQSFLRGFGRLLKRALWGGARVGRAFLRLFSRPPAAERIPQPGTRNGSLEAAPGAVAPKLPARPAVTEIKGTQKPPVPTTTDVKRSPSRPLRMPEQIPEATEEPVAPLVSVPDQPVPQPETSRAVLGDGREESEETQKPPTRPAVAGLAGTRKLSEAQPLERSLEASVTVAQPLEREQEVMIETTREVRTPRRRTPPSHRRSGDLPGGDGRPATAGTKQGTRKIVGRVHTRRTRPTSAAPKESVSLTEASGQLEGRPAAWVSTAQTIPALIEEGRFGRAESLLIDVLTKNPRDTEAYRLLGMIYLKRQEYTQAREVFEEALRRDPNHPGIHGLLGQAYFSLGEYGKALSTYQRAHDAEEENVEYLEKLLTIFSHMDRRPMVHVTAKKILALNPNHEEAKKALARMNAR